MKDTKKQIAPNPNCKDCHGRGKIIRTAPIPNINRNFIKRKNLPPKDMVRKGTLCHCVRLRTMKEV